MNRAHSLGRSYTPPSACSKTIWPGVSVVAKNAVETLLRGLQHERHLCRPPGGYVIEGADLGLDFGFASE
jgi:hypothetical protein